MLVQFSIKNFKSFKDKVTLSMVASNYDTSVLEEENVLNINNYNSRLLKSAVIYGANASGKTNILDALAQMNWFVINSATKTQSGDKIYHDPFKLNSTTEDEPSEFEVIFIENNIQYRYGYELTREKILSEWLYQKKLNNKPKEIELFYRENLAIEYHKSFEKIKKFNKEVGVVRENALLLSVSNLIEMKESREILNWFRKLDFFLGNDHDEYIHTSVNEIRDNTDVGNEIINILKKFDIGLNNIKAIDVNSESTNKGEIIVDLKSYHKKYDSDYNFIGNETFSFMEQESSGTQKLFAVLGNVLNVLKSGEILIIDELDSKLHHHIVHHLVKLFNSNKTNPLNAQIIFNTHNTHLLNENVFRRDQIWFLQKNRYGETKLFSLADIKARKEENFEEKYLEGRYGAIPVISDITELFDKI